MGVDPGKAAPPGPIALYGHPGSGHACKLALALALAGIEPRTIRIDIWAAPGIGDCAVRGYTQWLEAAGVAPAPVMQGRRDRMRPLAAKRSPVELFPAGA